MARKTSIDQLKTYFKTGSKPTEGQFVELIDSCYNAPKLSFDAKTQQLSISTAAGDSDSIADLKGIAPYSTRSWVHGHSLCLDEGSSIKAMMKKGWGTEVIGEIILREKSEKVGKDQVLILDGSTINTYHFAIPTPLMSGSVKIKNVLLDIELYSNASEEMVGDSKDKVSILSGANVKEILVYNGKNTLADFSSLASNTDLRTLSVPDMPPVTRAIGLSIGVEYYFQVYSKILIRSEQVTELKGKMDDRYTRARFYAVGCEFIVG